MASTPVLPDIIPSPDHSDSEPDGRSRVSRRRLLVLGGAGVLGAGLLFRLLNSLGGFRINQAEATTPVFDPATYRLTVDGDVENPVSLSIDELKALPAASQVSDFHCVEGWGVNNVRWQGVRLQTIIAMARPRNPAFITFHSLDGLYRDSLTMEQAGYPDVLLAYDMYERPLSARHGLPLRLVVPHMYGYKGPKWLTRVEFGGLRETGYWEQRGWQVDAWLS